MNLRRAVFGSRCFAREEFSLPLCAALCSSAFSQVSADETCVKSSRPRTKIDGEVEPILATYIDEGNHRCRESHASLILSPWTRPRTQRLHEGHDPAILSSSVRRRYVHPTGSRAASAGFYIFFRRHRRHGARHSHGAASPLIAGWRIPVAN